MSLPQIIRSITDLPVEVLEHIGQHLTLKTLNNLISVNKRMYDALNHSNVWKRYLHYPERYYKSDARSRSTNPAVRAVQEGISSGSLGKWRGYLLLQQARIATFRMSCGPVPCPCESIPLDDLEVFNMYDMVDDDGEHWLYIHGDDEKLRVWNLTASPRPVAALTMVGPGGSRRRVLQVLPQGRVLVQESSPLRKPSVLVYKFESSGNRFDLQHEFVYDVEPVDGDTPSPGSRAEEFAHAVVENKLVSCKKPAELSELRQLALHVWNLNSGTKAEIILGKSTAFVEFFNRTKHEKNDMRPTLRSKYRIILHPGARNTLIILLQSRSFEQTNILDLKTSGFTHLSWKEYPPNRPLNTSLCHTFGNKLCTASSFNGYRQNEFFLIDIYSIEIIDDCIELVGAEWPSLKSLKSTKLFNHNKHIEDSIHFQRSRMAMIENNICTIINLDTMNEQQISLPSIYQEAQIGGRVLQPFILCFVEPKFLLVYTECMMYSSRDSAGRVVVTDLQDNSSSAWFIVDTSAMKLYKNMICNPHTQQYLSTLAFIRRGFLGVKQVELFID